jgi:hypothetical protein
MLICDVQKLRIKPSQSSQPLTRDRGRGELIRPLVDDRNAIDPLGEV